MKNDSSFISMRLPTEVKEATRVQAVKNTRSLARQIIHYIKLGLKADGANIDGVSKVELCSRK